MTTTLKYHVCNLIIRQNDKNKFSPSEIAEEMLNFYSKKVGDTSSTDFTTILKKSLEEEENELLKAFIAYTLNFFMMLIIYPREESEEKKKLMEIGKPVLKESFENIMNLLHSEKGNDVIKEMSNEHQLLKK